MTKERAMTKACELADWRDEIGHPNNRLLFRRMVEVAGIDLGTDTIASALVKVTALRASPTREAVLEEADVETMLSRKWLDPECLHGGCQSLVWKRNYEAAVKGRQDFRQAYREARSIIATLRAALEQIELKSSGSICDSGRPDIHLITVTALAALSPSPEPIVGQSGEVELARIPRARYDEADDKVRAALASLAAEPGDHIAPRTAGWDAETVAAGAIIDCMTSSGFDWRSRLEDSDFLESADWLTALEYARAALRALKSPPIVGQSGEEG